MKRAFNCTHQTRVKTANIKRTNLRVSLDNAAQIISPKREYTAAVMKDGMTYHPDAMDGRMHTKCQAGHAMPGFMHDTRTTVGQLQRKLQVHPHSVARTTVVLLLIIERAVTLNTNISLRGICLDWKKLRTRQSKRPCRRKAGTDTTVPHPHVVIVLVYWSAYDRHETSPALHFHS